MIQLPWGNDVLRFHLPEGWRLLGQYQPQSLQPAPDAELACAHALASPVGARPLAARNLRGRRVLLVVDDWSRPTPVHRFFGSVRTALIQSGARAKDIEILFALGIHRPMTQEEAEHKVGRQNLQLHRWHNHNAFDLHRLINLGTTSRGTPVLLNRLLAEFDLIVALGALEPHTLVGFGGGSKMLLPGCAGARTIGQNHLLSASAERVNFVGVEASESPMRLDLEEGVSLLGKETFVVNVVLNEMGECVRFFCGDPNRTLQHGSEFVRDHTQITPVNEADVVITNSAPLDADFRQALKCLENTACAARPGGLVLGFFHCVHGIGDMPLPAWTLPYPILRSLLKLMSSRALLGVASVIFRRDPVEQRFLRLLGLQMLRRNHLWFYSSGLPEGTGRRSGMLRQFADIDKMLERAARLIGRPCTVSVFPQGGRCYVSGTRRQDNFVAEARPLLQEQKKLPIDAHGKPAHSK